MKHNFKVGDKVRIKPYDEVKQTIDDWAQSLANYESADPLSNSHARKLHIDTY